jgi:hypothetical protein
MFYYIEKGKYSGGPTKLGEGIGLAITNFIRTSLLSNLVVVDSLV